MSEVSDYWKPELERMSSLVAVKNAENTRLKAEKDRLVKIIDTIETRARNAISGVSDAMKDHDLKAIQEEIQRIREELRGGGV